MELNITEMFGKFFNGVADCYDYQDSIAHSGCDAIARITWNNAKDAPFKLVTDENRQDVIDYFDAYGAWDGLDAWENNELNALLIQEIVSNIQDLERLEWDWQAYQEEAENGQISGRLFQTDIEERTGQGKVYFNL